MAGGLGSIAGKLLAKLNLCGKMGRLLNKAICPGVQMATEMAVTEGASQAFNQGVDDAFVPDNCFVAGTPVWVLRDGVNAEQANEAIENGASWEDYAEQKPIEDVEAGDYALSRPEDNADGQLSFNLVTETYTNTTEELVHLWVLDYATGEAEKLTTTPGHPFWVDDEWTFATEIVAGDSLIDADGDTLTVASATSEARHAATYNFCVAWDHTYYVGQTSTWTHNMSVATGAGRDHVTYRGIKHGKPYTGYASAPSSLGLDADDIVTRRYGGDLSAFGGVQPRVEYEGTGVRGKQTARGLEHHFWEQDVKAAGGDKSKVANRQRPVGPRNRNADNYSTAAKKHLNSKGKAGGC